MSSCRRLVRLMLVAGLLIVPASASAEDAIGPLDSSTTIEETVAAETAPAVSIASDLADYAPGSTVTLTGTGWAPGEAVHLEIAEVDGEGWTHTVDVAADGDGVLVYAFDLPDRYVPDYNVTATGATSGTATTSFTDTIGGVGGSVPTGGGAGDRSVASTAAGGATSISVTRPSTRAAGDFLLAAVTVKDLAATDNICAPSGWTLVRRDDSVGAAVTASVTQAIFYKFAATATEDVPPNPGQATPQFTFRDGACPASGSLITRAATAAMLRYTRVDPTAPIDAHGGATGWGTSLTAPSVTTTFANDRVVNLYGSRLDTPDMTNVTFQNSPTAGGTATGAEDFSQAAPGATAAGTATAGNDYWVGQTVALKPADQGSIELRKDWVGTAGNATLSITTDEPIGAGAALGDDRDAKTSGGLTNGVTLSRPPNKEIGDFLLATVTVEDLGAASICAPAGWTLLRRDDNGTGLTQAVYYRFVNDTNAANYAFTYRAPTCAGGFATGRFGSGVLIRYTGVDQTSPIDAHGGSTGTGTSLTAPSVTTNFANDRVVNVYGSKLDAPNMSNVTFEVSFDAGGTATGAEDFTQAAAGVTPAGTATAGNDLWIGQTVALKQAANTVETTPLTGTDGTTGQKTRRSGAKVFLSETFDSPTNAGDYTADLTCFEDRDNDGEDDGAGEPAVTPGANNEVMVTTHVICTFTNTEQAGSVSGTKFDDVNRDGDPTGESGLQGWRINAFADDGGPNDLDTAGDGTLGPDEESVGPAAFADTDVNGDYTIALRTGTYVICEEQQTDWVQTAPAPAGAECAEADADAPGGHGVTVSAGQDEADTDFGNDHLATVSGSKFDDFNRDTAWDPNGANNTTPDADDEPGLSGWTIEAYADDGDGELSIAEAGVPAADSTTTDGDGNYELKLPSGDYVVCEQLQSGWAQTTPDPDTKRCGEVTGAAPGGHVADLDPGEQLGDQDFGNNRSGRVQGFKFEDVNRDGAQDPDGENDTTPDSDDEIVLEGWTIEAYAVDGDGNATGDPVADDVTDVKGFYELTLPVGSWVICEQDQSGWTQSTPDPDTKNCGSIKDLAPGGHAVELDQGEELDRDFGNFRSGGVNGFKFDDRNRDGVRDPDGANNTPGDADDEPLLVDWVVGAYEPDTNGDATGSPVDTDVVDPKGFYELTEVPVGDWVICETQQPGWAQSAPSNDKCEAIDADAPGGHDVTVTQGNIEADKDFGNYRTATVTVYKEYSDGSTAPAVDVRLECTNGWDETKESDPAGDPAVFTVGGFAATGDTCDVTEVEDVPGYTADVSGCENIALTAGGTPDCTVVNVLDASIVTAGGCEFDRMTDRDGFQFPLIFTPDTGAYYKLNATNPGQFFLNVVYDSGTDDPDTIEIEIPFPFVLAGTNPIKVHSDVDVTTTNGKTCYSPSGSLLSQESDQVTWDYTSPAPVHDFGDTQSITVDAPENGLVFVRIHMAYDLKGIARTCEKKASTPSTNPSWALCSLPRANFDIGGAPSADGFEQYAFSFSGEDDAGDGEVESYNDFKKNPGIGGLVLAANTLTPFANTKADIYQGTKKVATVYTDQDGWYLWTYKYTGKATTFTVKLPNNGNASQSATLKSNGYLNIPFTLP